ncbi:MAG: hypothetical protein ABJG78_12900 [Cyclobacteriaceae bacterium]
MSDSTMSVKDWVITIIIAAIPLVGLIMLFIWGFGSGTNQNKANWAKAVLIFYLIMIVFYFVFGAALIGGILASGGF